MVSASGAVRARRITVGQGSDNMSPEFSPDGGAFAFTSGRAGHPEVYIIDVDGSNVELLTPFNFGDQNYRSQSRLGAGRAAHRVPVADRRKVSDHGDLAA